MSDDVTCHRLAPGFGKRERCIFSPDHIGLCSWEVGRPPLTRCVDGAHFGELSTGRCECGRYVVNDDVERVANELAGPPVDSHVSRAYALREEFHQLTAVDEETRTRMWRAIAERRDNRWAIEHAGAPCNVPKHFERSDIPMLIGFVLAAAIVLFAVCDGGVL